jgi:hypothetical protein
VLRVHSLHDVEPGIAVKEPGGHLVQLVDADVLEKEPGAHIAHSGALFDAANVPGVHAVQVAEPAAAAVPAKHAVQPAVTVRMPAGHIWQRADPLVENVPGGQLAHVTELVVFANWSGPQLRQRVEPLEELQGTVQQLMQHRCKWSRLP